MNEFEFESLKENEFEEVYSRFIEKDGTKAYVPNGNNIIKVLLNGQIIGVTRFQPLFGDIEVDLSLFPEYRGKGYAGEIMDQIVEKFGEEFSNSKLFLSLIKYENKSSIRSREKSDWKDVTSSYYEIFHNEGEYFKVYAKNNPYYKENTR